MVHITKVDIFGFKSFGFKNTTVNFEPGLVSISGPNGSGKSNILDAIIFAMGENKPSVMRAPKLRALIHDIEGNRRGPKLTRVKVQFDNSDRKIPVPSDTVSISREMSEHGESVYHLDNKKMNRTQILDLLDMADAGLNQLNAVQQGTVTRISEFSNEEKRKTIEDLIGLSYFDEKKNQSLKQLTDADQKLEVAMAKMGEVKKQIDELEVERNLKLRYDLLGRELDRYRALDAASKLKIIKDDKSSKEENFNSNTSELKKLGEERSILKNEITKLREEKSEFLKDFNAYNEAKQTIDTKLSSATREFDESDSKIKTSDNRILQIEKRQTEISDELELMSKDEGVVDSKIESIKNSVRKTTQEKNSIKKKIEDTDSALKLVLDHQSEISAQKNKFDKKIQELKDQLHNVTSEKSNTITNSNNIQNKIDNNTKKHKIRIEELTNLQKHSEQLSKVVFNRQSSSSQIKLQISNLSNQRIKIERDISELESILEKSSLAANRYNEKIKLVKGVLHEDYTISQLKNYSEKLGIDGLVYEILSWSKQYERAVLAVSSDWVKAIVVPDLETLTSLAHVVRSKNLPKLKIIPLNTIPELHFKLPKTPGAIGILSDYVQCDEKYRPIARFLFGNVILTETGKDAYKLSNAGYKAVSMDGEFFESKVSAMTIDIDSKISKLTKIISQSSTVEGLLETITLLRKHIQKKKQRLKKIENKHRHYMEQQKTSDTEVGTTSHSNNNLKSRINNTVKLNEDFSTRILQLKKQKEQLAPRIIQLTSSIESLKQRITLVRQNYSDIAQNSVAEKLRLLNKEKAEYQTSQTRIVNKLTEEEASISVIVNEKKQKKRQFENERSSLSTEKDELKVSIIGLQEKKKTSEDNLIVLRDEEQKLISTSGTSASKLTDFDDTINQKKDTEDNTTTRINKLERESDTLERDLLEIKGKELSLNKILRSFEFDGQIETFDVDPLIQSLDKEHSSLASSLNAIAPQRYVEISTGYRSMSGRKNDLEEERNTIVSFIESIEKDKRQTFLDAFDTVDKEIRGLFNKMNGGNAWLELENEDDIFNSGISYIIQFQNKPKRESTSISGGEKTLAAVVFVLALQKLKPSPFYLFDEIDAHLDAPNAERLANIVEERSNGSQFIMVSLKDSVVQKAKLIYGVYPERGVSKVVTYKDKRIPSISKIAN